MAAQTFKNHSRIHPLYHLLLLPLNVILVVAALVHEIARHSPPNLLLVFVTFSLLLLTVLSRHYALRVQDRVIRLEENVRMHHLGVDPSSLSLRQLIALRFASDAEAPELARRAAAERLTPKQIKAEIVQWRADHDRI
jgi:hypothetical protein